MAAYEPDDTLRKLLDLAEAEKYEAAIDYCFSVLDEGDIDRGFWTLQIGLLYFLNYWNTGALFEEAPRFVEKAVWLSPHSPDAHFWFGWVSQIAFGDTLLARREYEECLELVPEHPYSHLALAGIGLPPSETKRHLERVLERQPENYRALMLYSAACADLGDIEAAQAALNRVLDCRPYVETGYGVMNHYINDVFNGSWRQDEIADEARKKLDELRPLLP